MQAGQLRHRITIQQRAQTVVDGDQVTTWTDVWTCSAAIEPISGREYFSAASISADVSHRIRIRYTSAFAPLPNMQIVYGSRTFDIQTVMNVEERNHELHLMTKERVLNG
jgi:SPP1 family predicted phage head-tail adaptor